MCLGDHRVRYAIALIIAGCGRIGFDALTDGVVPGQLVVGTAMRINDDPLESRHPDVVWTGTEFGYAWRGRVGGSIDILFSRLDATGTKLSELSVTPLLGSGQDNPSVVWNGTDFAIAFRDDRTAMIFQIYLARVDASGNEISDEVETTMTLASSNGPALAWNGAGYGVAWVDETTSLHASFGRMDRNGARVGTDLGLGTTSDRFERVALVWTGTEYGVTWVDARDVTPRIAFARLDATGAKIGSDALVSAAGEAAGSPSLAWSGDEFVITYDNCPLVTVPAFEMCPAASAVHLVRIDRSGALVAPPITIAAGARPDLAWDGGGFAIAWLTTMVNVARLTANGELMGTPQLIASDGLMSWPSVAPTPTGFGVAWSDFVTDVWFVRVEYAD